jgi:hypothetical protein
MMVVLTEWERDANLLRARRTSGSLRFLFLDEANRLSRDNLGVLFDLCRTLDLQLLIAAPEVARADGNTTYRLVRKVTEDGREEVIVSGRRALSAEPTLLSPPAPAVVQGSRFQQEIERFKRSLVPGSRLYDHSCFCPQISWRTHIVRKSPRICSSAVPTGE